MAIAKETKVETIMISLVIGTITKGIRKTKMIGVGCMYLLEVMILLLIV